MKPLGSKDLFLKFKNKL